ncbi:hypothetical protein M9978_04190 [Sphingomonas sp. MG17]|uniref:Lecithin retinol acyltransferase n=1 Tax=Sphingomonas tagetis TaxID=2949092 RepID=A0A9X2HNH0_9SPHN|nr:hypothetical protein [Sphingomonas tagetis]MCP3729620.1 hypothetical protein [Sphingomonas tagetis]
MLRRIARLAPFLLLVFAALPAQARVTITFWSYENGGDFPHAFFTIHGVPDRGGGPVRLSYGFTAKAVTPAILLGSVPGKIDLTTKGYVAKSLAHFATPISDEQYDAVVRLVSEWNTKGGNSYNVNNRNCVHFVAEAMRRSGLRVTIDKKLIKKPRSFTRSIAAQNVGRVAVIDKPSVPYLAATPALVGVGVGK